MHAAFAVLLLTASVQTGALTFTAPAEWKPRPAASTMRVAEFVPARAPGDSEDADVIIYFFGRMPGSVQANIDRWVGQFKTEGPSPAKVSPETSTINGLKVTMMAIEGTYIAEVKPGSAERYNKPNFRMRAAVVETPKGPYFIKLTGPTASVKQASPGYDQFLKSLKFQ